MSSAAGLEHVTLRFKNPFLNLIKTSSVPLCALRILKDYLHIILIYRMFLPIKRIIVWIGVMGNCDWLRDLL